MHHKRFISKPFPLQIIIQNIKETMILIIFTSISFTYGWTVSTDKLCKCEALSIQSDCSQANCMWSSQNICQNVNCIGLDQSQCYSYQKACAYNTRTKSCTSFNYCKELEGRSTNDCSSQNLSCTWVSGIQCISLSDCSQFNSSTCPSTCYNNGSSCISYSKCSQMNQQLCNASSFCIWDGQCQPMQCSNFFSSDSCLFSHVVGSSVQPCLWQSGFCVNAQSQEVFDSQTCFTHTAQAYHWAPKERKQSAYYCKLCYQFLFTIQIVLIALFQ